MDIYELLMSILHPYQHAIKEVFGQDDYNYDDSLDLVLDVAGVSEADRKKAIALGSDIPIVGDLWKYMDRQKQIQDYMDNTGLSWDDVKYPALMNSGGNYFLSFARQGTNFVSKNIERLYKKH